MDSPPGAAPVSAYILPLLLGSTVLWAVLRGQPAFQIFLKGAREGLQTALGLLPTLVGLLAAVSMLRASGALELVGWALEPVLSQLGFPAEVVPLLLTKPFTGAGSLALGSQIIRDVGADSYAGRLTAVLLASCETTFYTVTVYFGATRAQHSRYALPAAYGAAVWAVKLFF